MTSLFKYLMVFCVLAGLHASAVASDVCRSTTCSELVDHWDSPDNCSASSRKDIHHEGDPCPLDHHHHCDSCTHALPMIVESEPVCQIGIAGILLIGSFHESDLAPEEPFLSSEKPPLI